MFRRRKDPLGTVEEPALKAQAALRRQMLIGIRTLALPLVPVLYVLARLLRALPGGPPPRAKGLTLERLWNQAGALLYSVLIVAVVFTLLLDLAPVIGSAGSGAGLPAAVVEGLVLLVASLAVVWVLAVHAWYLAIDLRESR